MYGAFCNFIDSLHFYLLLRVQLYQMKVGYLVSTLSRDITQSKREQPFRIIPFLWNFVDYSALFNLL